MKITRLILALLAASVGASPAQTTSPAPALGQSAVPTSAQSPGPYRVVNRTANSRTWQRENVVHMPNGHDSTIIHRYTEVASGMNYQTPSGAWAESKEIIEPFANGSISRQGQYQVIYANNLNSPGAIDLQAADGKRLRSNILGLMYYDRSSDQSVVIASIQDSTGELIANNQVLYVNAFDGIKADVRYTYRRGSFEQDVILKERPPTPQSLNLNPDTTELEVMTEFLNPPREKLKERSIRTGQSPDQDVLWGSTYIGRGRAFDLAGGEPGKLATVRKQYTEVNGRKILLEKVSLKDMQAGLSRLPRHAGIKSKLLKTAFNHLALPTIASGKTNTGPMRLAHSAPIQDGYVLDYIALNADQTNFTFQADTTYYVSGDFNLHGTTTIEGGTVIKMDNSNPSSLNVLDTINCQTAAYCPAIFTSDSDSTVGESVGGSPAFACTGTLDLRVVNNFSSDLYLLIYDDFYNYYADWNLVGAGNTTSYSFTAGFGQHFAFASYDTTYWNEYYHDFWPTLTSGTLTVDANGNVTYSETGAALCTPTAPPSTALSLANGGVIHDVRFSNLGLGINSSGDYSVTNAQFVACATALQSESVYFYAGNILMSGVGTGFYGQDYQGICEQSTFDQSTLLTDDPDGLATASTLTLNNSLVTAVGSYGVVPVTTNAVATLSSNVGIYQVAGAGSYYLPSNSPYHLAGTATVDPGILADIAAKTTYAPAIYSNQAVAGGTYSPCVPRDTNSTPDLGYHYSSLDYCFGGANAATNIVFTAGTAVGWFELPGTGGGLGYGLSLPNSSSVTYAGIAIAPCVQARYSTVQEEGNGNWPDIGIVGCVAAKGGGFYNRSIASIVNAQFTLFACNAWQPCIGGPNTSDIIFNLTHSVLNSGNAVSWDVVACFTNCLLLGADAGCEDFDSSCAGVYLQNCTMHEGRMIIAHFGVSTWPFNVQNCAFDNVDFSQLTTDGTTTDPSITYCDYNAYVTGQDQLPMTGAHDKSVTSFNWQSSYLGNYYLPSDSPLILAGSTNANLLGLYYFTTQTGQTEEGTTTVDVGYHYVAIDPGTGQPYETFTNGVPDYLLDSHGTGLPDWWLWQYFGSYAYISTNLDSTGTNTLLYDYAHGLDPNVINFSCSFLNQYVNTNLVTGSITVFSGFPSSIAVLVDSTNFLSATWTAYVPSNVTVNLGSTQGLHDVWIGLQVSPVDTQPVWQETTLVLDSFQPTISITNPVNNASFNSSRVDLSGNYVAGSLKQIMVNGVLAFIHGTNYDALNVPLLAGTNAVVATIEDQSGSSNTTSINIITLTNVDGSLNNPVQLQATPVTGFSPIPVAFQIQTNLPGTIQQISYDFNGDDIADFITNDLAAITNVYATNGEYFPVVTIQTTAGRFSSVGGWNAVALDASNQPISIDVRSNVTIKTFANITDPVDVKWVGTNLYVLSRSTATLTEFDAGGDIIRSTNNLGLNPSGFDVDAAGNVYVAVTGSNQVWKLNPVCTTFAPDAVFGYRA